MRQFTMKHSLLWVSAATWVTIALAVWLLAGCATTSQGGGVMPLPSIECKGKGVITGTGQVSAAMLGAAGNSFTLQADCGDLGFTFKQAPAPTPTPTSVK